MYLKIQKFTTVLYIKYLIYKFTIKNKEGKKLLQNFLILIYNQVVVIQIHSVR